MKITVIMTVCSFSNFVALEEFFPKCELVIHSSYADPSRRWT